MKTALHQGHGLAYGTKEGRLRLVRHASTVKPSQADKRAEGSSAHGLAARLEQELAEADQVATRESSDMDD